MTDKYKDYSRDDSICLIHEVQEPAIGNDRKKPVKGKK
jgi:hypothetical protein